MVAGGGNCFGYWDGLTFFPAFAGRGRGNYLGPTRPGGRLPSSTVAPENKGVAGHGYSALFIRFTTFWGAGPGYGSQGVCAWSVSYFLCRTGMEKHGHINRRDLLLVFVGGTNLALAGPLMAPGFRVRSEERRV